MKKIVLLFLISTAGFAQNLNSYKYVLVPSRFLFQTEKGQYNVNNLTRMILEKNGFETYFDDEKLTEDFAKDNCNKLYADLEVKNTMFSTKVKIILKDCKNNIVFESSEGKSVDKNYSIAYSQALQLASQSLNMLLHDYKPSQKSLEMVGEPIFQEKKDIGTPIILTAKKTSNGYDLVTTDPEIIYMNLKTTSLKDIFIAVRQNYQGILFKSEENWFFEYYYNSQKNTELITIHF